MKLNVEPIEWSNRDYEVLILPVVFAGESWVNFYDSRFLAGDLPILIEKYSLQSLAWHFRIVTCLAKVNIRPILLTASSRLVR